MRLNENVDDQILNKVSNMPGYETPAKNIKRVKLYKKMNPTIDIVKKTSEKKVTVRELCENEEYPDLKKIRVKSFRKLIGLLIYLKAYLIQNYPDKRGDIIINKIQDLNPEDIPEDILNDLEISKRSLYDYLNTLQMLLDYSDY